MNFAPLAGLVGSLKYLYLVSHLQLIVLGGVVILTGVCLFDDLFDFGRPRVAKGGLGERQKMLFSIEL